MGRVRLGGEGDVSGAGKGGGEGGASEEGRGAVVTHLVILDDGLRDAAVDFAVVSPCLLLPLDGVPRARGVCAGESNAPRPQRAAALSDASARIKR